MKLKERFEELQKAGKGVTVVSGGLSVSGTIKEVEEDHVIIFGKSGPLSGLPYLEDPHNHVVSFSESLVIQKVLNEKELKRL